MSDKKTNPIMTPEWFASLLETCVVPDGESTAPPPADECGGGGMSLRGIELIDMHTKCEDLLVFGHVTKKEVAELAEALLRLVRKVNVTYDQKV